MNDRQLIVENKGSRSSKQIELIKSQPHHRFVFEPDTFVEELVPRETNLRELISQCAVRLRGWDFPHLEDKLESSDARDSITSWSSFRGHHECWRFFRSGLFAHLSRLREDDEEYRRKLSDSGFWPEGRKPKKFLSIYDSLWLVTEAYEFLARLCSAQVYSENITVTVAFHGTIGRALSFGTMERLLHNIYMADCDPVIHEATVSSLAALTRPKELALEAVKSLYADFGGADFADQVLQDMQQELYRGR